MKNTLNRLLFEESSKNFALIVSTCKLLQFLEIHLNKILSKMSLNSANLNENQPEKQNLNVSKLILKTQKKDPSLRVKKVKIKFTFFII